MGGNAMKIRNVVFDIGNVLADYRWYGFCRTRAFPRK